MVRFLDDDAGGSWFRVDVVVRTGRLSSDQLLAAVVPGLAAVADAPVEVTGPEPAASYDAEPPEGSAGVGVWVRGGSVGAAVDAAVRLVQAAAAAADGGASLWDVRALPIEAVLRVPPAGSVAALRADGPDLI